MTLLSFSDDLFLERQCLAEEINHAPSETETNEKPGRGHHYKACKTYTRFRGLHNTTHFGIDEESCAKHDRPRPDKYYRIFCAFARAKQGICSAVKPDPKEAVGAQGPNRLRDLPVSALLQTRCSVRWINDLSSS